MSSAARGGRVRPRSGSAPAPWSQDDAAMQPKAGESTIPTTRLPTPQDEGVLLKEKIEDERLERLAELQEARERAAEEKSKDDENKVPNLYSWSAEQVAQSMRQAGFPECSEYVTNHRLEGRRFLNLEDSAVGLLLEPIAKDTKSIRKVGAHFRGIRSEELANVPKLTALITTKIDGSKRSCNLVLNDMKLTSFPDMICDIPQLTNISAVHNRMRTVPAEIGLLARLVNLKLGQNKLISLPESIGRCRALQMLMVEENAIKVLPRSLGHCAALRVVDVSRNELQMIPSTMSRCQKIVKLVAFDNPLKLPREVMDEGTKAVLSLLDSISNAEEGHYLRLFKIKLHAIPEFTFDMTSLTMLNLDNNRIMHLDGLHVLTGLTSLSFVSNTVEHVPLSFATLTELREFKYSENPITSPPLHVMALGPRILVRYLAARAALLSENLHEAFHVFDDDNSGSVNRTELIQGLEKVNLKVSKEDVIALVEEHDDGNGLIDFDEFKTIILQLIQHRSAGPALARPETGDAAGETLQQELSATQQLAEQPADDRKEQLDDEILDLSNLEMTEYTIDLDEPGRVTVLNLSCNNLTGMPSVRNLKCVRTLILDSNPLTDVPESIFKLPTLRRLSMKRCQLSWLPDSLFAYSGLEELGLDCNRMGSLPCDLVRMTSLSVLTLDDNPFRDPLMSISREGMDYTMAYLKFFYQAREFGVLDLREMDFSEMPFESDVAKVQEIILSKNCFQVAPDLLLTAKTLTSLDFSDNFLEKIPSTIWEAVTNLVTLRLSNNRLQALARTVGDLHKLESFWIDENTLEDLPNTLSSLRSLKHFDLTHNRLKNLHVSVGGLARIECLILNRNNLVTLPEEIQGMTSLKKFMLRSNDMEVIPDVWDKLNLTQLDLSRNPLKALPLSLGALVTSMQEISVDRHLHLDDPPDNMVARGTKPLLSYLQKQYLARQSSHLVLSSFHLAKVTVPLQQLDYICRGLRTLDVSDNNIQELPRNIGMCASMESLLVRDNRLAEFPASAKQLKTLTHLDVSGNSFEGVPEMLTYTPLIRILDLSRNQIRNLYRTVDDVTTAGFSDALKSGKRAKGKDDAEKFEGRRLRQIIDLKVMDRVAAKLRSENRSKQVGALFQLYNLEKLSLASNHVKLLPGTVARFTVLKELNMSHNELEDMPPDIGDLVRLRRIDLSHNGLYGVPMEMGKLVKVKYLDVSHNKLLSLPDELGNMTSLTDLNFEHNDLKFLPVTLEALETCLTKLNADANRIMDPPAEILHQGRDAVFTYFRRVRNGQKCRDLVLIDMKLEVLELNWSNLTVLTALELSGNRIKSLPVTFRCLTNLVVLKAAGNSLERMFDAGDLSPLSNITRLALKENHITEVEDNIGDLVKLKDLDLSCNRLVKIAPQIEKCTNIKRLVLSQNQLHHIPKNVFRILVLEIFDACNNALRSLPPAICYCKSLTELSLAHNQIETLPSDLGNLVALSRLNMGTNMLRALPTSIKYCEHLKVLVLNNNKMSYLPTEIKKLRKLTHLNIKDNNIVSIPIEIKDLGHLQEIEMDGNLFLSAPSSIKELPKIKEITINPSQTAALFCGGNDITSILTVKDLSQDRIVLNKVPRAHALAGTDSMSNYLDRMDQRESLPSLNLTHMKLTFLPQEVFALTALTVLDIKENEIERLPETIGKLSKIVHLDISVNKMKRLPDSIGALRNLSTLSLARNQLEYLPTSLKNLSDLKYIDVHVNCLHTVLPEEVFSEWERRISERETLAVFVDTPTSPATPATPATPKTPTTPITPSTPSRRLQRRKSLHVDQAGFSEILAPLDVILPKGGVVLLAGLRDFECSYNELSELPDLSEMINLTRINVAHNHLRDLPEVICELDGLEKIECGDNRVRSVPKSVSKLTRLTLLSLKNNNLRRLPKELGDCVALRTLSLNANDLVAIPDEMCKLRSVKRLTLAANNLQFLPWRMGDMVGLHMLDLSSNPIIRLPASLGLLNDILQKIELFECDGLIEPPEPIIEAGHGRLMDYLRKLWRGFTTMRMVLTGLGMGGVEFDIAHPDLQGLVELRLDKNNLKNLPDTISELPNLMSLRFRENTIVTLHDCFSKLQTLQELDMSKNRFVNIPPSVLKLTQLARLRVTNNPIPYTMPNDWVEKDVAGFLANYVRETIGRRISTMWSNNNLAEFLAAWKDIVDELEQQRLEADT